MDTAAQKRATEEIETSKPTAAFLSLALVRIALSVILCEKKLSMDKLKKGNIG